MRRYTNLRLPLPLPPCSDRQRLFGCVEFFYFCFVAVKVKVNVNVDLYSASDRQLRPINSYMSVTRHYTRRIKYSLEQRKMITRLTATTVV